MKRQHCLISLFALSLAEIAAEGAVMMVVLLELCMFSKGRPEAIITI